MRSIGSELRPTWRTSFSCHGRGNFGSADVKVGELRRGRGERHCCQGRGNFGEGEENVILVVKVGGTSARARRTSFSCHSIGGRGRSFCNARSSCCLRSSCIRDHYESLRDEFGYVTCLLCNKSNNTQERRRQFLLQSSSVRDQDIENPQFNILISNGRRC